MSPVIARTGLNYPAGQHAPLGRYSLAAGIAGGVLLLIAQLPWGRSIAALSLIAGGIAGVAAWAFRTNPQSALDSVATGLGIRSLAGGTLTVLAGAVSLCIGAVITLVTPRSGTVVAIADSPHVRRASTRSSRPRIPVPDLSPNWLADPAGRYQFRFWDGGKWTDRVATGGVEYEERPMADPAQPPSS